MKASSARLSRRFVRNISGVFVSSALAGTAFAADPLASNNGLYPSPDEYQGRFVLANHDYPTSPVASGWVPSAGLGPLTTETAHEFVSALQKHIGPTISTLVNDPENWDPVAAGWYDMVWSGESAPRESDGKTDPTLGREALMNSFTGQIMPAVTFSEGNRPETEVQNHAVIYYNGTAAAMLGEVWEDLYSPNVAAAQFPEGSIVVKVEAIPMSQDNWKVLKGSSTWKVFRPSIGQQMKANDPDNPDPKPLTAEVVEAHPLQMSIKIKDSVASPETGWVFLGLVYDTNFVGETVWDKFVPIGAMWGNDPEFANHPKGVPEGESLKETWVNKAAPSLVQDTLGWGERLAGPMDVATRHNVITPSGKRYRDAEHLRASSCLSCHSSSEFPFTANLYPSPNKSFPKDGEPFLLYDPGSKDWAKWFQNRKGTEPMSSNIGGRALDYDMVMMFALSAFSAAAGDNHFVQERFDVH